MEPPEIKGKSANKSPPTDRPKAGAIIVPYGERKFVERANMGFSSAAGLPLSEAPGSASPDYSGFALIGDKLILVKILVYLHQIKRLNIIFTTLIDSLYLVAIDAYCGK